MKKKKHMTMAEFSRLGVKARQAKTTPEQRKAIARKAAKARWAKKETN